MTYTEDAAAPLTFTRFSIANRDRCNMWHPNGVNSWTLSEWMTALVGEVGEAANIVKKLNRDRDGLVGNKETAEELKEELAKELADILIYLDLLARAADVQLAEAVVKKFNSVSEKHGFPHRINHFGVI